MAGDWIKMRVSLAKDPAVIAMADHLAEQRAFMDWLTDPVRCHCKESAYEHVTRNVTVAVTVSALLVFWGVANEVGKPDGDDLVLRHATLESVDESSGVPGFGDAMAYVDWAIAEEQGGRYQLRLPKFLINNVPAEDRSKKGNAERQRRFREKHALEGNDKSNVTDNVTVTHREEKRREEKKDQEQEATPLGAGAPPFGVHQPIVDAYHELLPSCQPIATPSPKRLKRLANAAKLAKRVCASHGWTYEPGTFWHGYFAVCANDPWLRGDVANPNNARWKQNLDVLLADERLAQVIDQAINSMREAE